MQLSSEERKALVGEIDLLTDKFINPDFFPALMSLQSSLMLTTRTHTTADADAVEAVAALAKRWFGRDDPGFDIEYTDFARAALEAAAPHGDLEAMLNSVHDVAVIGELWWDIEAGFDGDDRHEGQWRVHIEWPSQSAWWEPLCDVGHAEGTGPTRVAAIRAAVANAKDGEK